MALNSQNVLTALDSFRIEVPSWGFADTGTRFGKFMQDSAASTLEEKFSDAGQVHYFTGVCPSVALHVLWDLPAGTDLREVIKLSEKYGVRAGSINPNVFQDQEYKHGSLANERPEVRQRALDHILGVGVAGQAVGLPRPGSLAGRRLELSWHGEYSSSQAVDRRGLPQGARSARP